MRVAVIQAEPVDALYSERNLPRALKLLDEAAKKEADIACFPDGFPSTGEKEICKKARDLDIHVIASIAKKTQSHKYYDESLMISSKGEVLGRHKKVILLWMFEPDLIEPGKEFKVFKTSLGNIGILKCSETLYPEPASILARNGADIIFVQANFPTNILELWHRILLVRAWENWVPIAAANVAVWVKTGVVYKDVELTTVYGGKSVIIVPEELGRSMEELPIVTFSRGDFFAERRMIRALAGHSEEIIYSDIDLNFYAKLRSDFLKYRKFRTEGLGSIR